MTTEIRVICTDRGTHPSREIALLTRFDDDPELLSAMVADDEMTEQSADAVHRWDRVGYWDRRDARRGDRVQVGKVEFGFTQTEDGPTVDQVGEVGDGQGALWRFRCPTCRRDLPMRDDTVSRLIDGLRAAGRTSVDLSYLGASLS